MAGLLGLPTELRREIFHHVLEDPDTEETETCCFEHSVIAAKRNVMKCRMQRLTALLQVSKMIHAEVENMLIKTWQISLCIAHAISYDDHDSDGPHLYGPQGYCWGKGIAMATLESNEQIKLERMLKYTSRVDLITDFGALRGSNSTVVGSHRVHWAVLDNMRCLVQALNASGRPKVLRMTLNIHSLDQTDEDQFSFAEFYEFLGTFEALNDNISLDLEVVFTEEMKEQARDLSIKEPFEIDENYTTRLQDHQRSRHFPRTSSKGLLEEWLKLGAWANSTFKYTPVRDSEVFAHFVALAHEEVIMVLAQMSRAWEAHHHGDVVAFKSAKEELEKSWGHCNDTREPEAVLDEH